ncbi:MAG: hypothetical protein QM756_13380 [Polyangiaceae bacterium]
MRKGVVAGGFGLLLLACCAALATRLTGGSREFSRLGLASRAPAVGVPSARVVAGPRTDACAARRTEIENEVALAGVPELEAVRGEVLARARAQSVLFLSMPEVGELPPELSALRARLFSEPAPWNAFSDVYERLRSRPRDLRAVLLTEGYLFAAQPQLAALLASGVSLDHLFREPELVIQRGDKLHHVQREKGVYRWVDGPSRGELARLWLFDQVWAVGEQPPPSRHVALAELSELGTTSIELTRVTENALLARLHYGEVVVPAVLRIEQGRARLECESVPEQAEAVVEAAHAGARRYARVLSELRARVAEQVEEALPFDEPKTEEGQQDGKLRPAWRTAYLQGQTSFTFNEDRYPVFDSAGRARLPQVCVDFVLDTWERMAGTRWLRREEGRGRHVGRLDVTALGMENQRSVEQFIEFARTHPAWFDLFEVGEAERVPFSARRRFFQRLVEVPDRFRPGDVVAILGPRDDERLHYHSFFIVEADPLTGMPTLLAANAGRPRMRNWEAELENAPRRGIVARIRPRLGFLEALLGATDQALNPQIPGESPPG